MPHKYTLPELAALSDRLIARGTSKMFESQPEVQKDILLAGRILAALLLSGKINSTVELK